MTIKDIWTTYNKEVRQFVLSKVKNEQVAEDLLQEVFIKIYIKLDTFKGQDKIKSWVFTVARNTVIDYFRQKTNSREFFETDELHDGEPKTHDEKDCLHAIIKKLPKIYRDPLVLADLKGLKQAEVANQLKLQLPTAKSRIQRARKLIAQGYMECCDFKMNKKGHLVGEVKDKEDCKVCN